MLMDSEVVQGDKGRVMDREVQSWAPSLSVRGKWAEWKLVFNSCAWTFS